jgi:hypothetical protein
MKKDLIRVAAKENGDKYYIPEKPCARGHLLRTTAGGSCVECRRFAEKKRYYANPEKTKVVTKNKYHKNADKIRAGRKKYYDAHKNDPVVKAVARAKVKRWRELNPNHENTKRLKRIYKLNNPHKIQADTAKYRAAKMDRIPKWLTEEDLWLIDEIYELAALRSKQTGFEWHVDHIIPLQGKLISGLHTPDNLQVIPWLDNIKKANKFEVA